MLVDHLDYLSSLLISHKSHLFLAITLPLPKIAHFVSEIGKCFHWLTFRPLLCADSKTLKEEKREELFEDLKANESIGWAVDVIDPRELSAKMLKKYYQNFVVSSRNTY